MYNAVVTINNTHWPAYRKSRGTLVDLRLFDPTDRSPKPRLVFRPEKLQELGIPEKLVEAAAKSDRRDSSCLRTCRIKRLKSRAAPTNFHPNSPQNDSEENAKFFSSLSLFPQLLIHKTWRCTMCRCTHETSDLKLVMLFDCRNQTYRVCSHNLDADDASQEVAELRRDGLLAFTVDQRSRHVQADLDECAACPADIKQSIAPLPAFERRKWRT